MVRALALLLAVLALAGCGGDDGTSAETTTAAATTEQPQAGDPAAGETLFTEQGCGNCHTLQDAGTTGTVGPNLDDAQPTYDEAFTAIKNGRGGMPAFGDKLSDRQIADLAAYVAESTKG
jgi:cytochrome c6